MKQLTEKQKEVILHKTGAEKINLIPRTSLKPEIIETRFINKIGKFIYTDCREERYNDVGVSNKNGHLYFHIGKEKTRKVVNVTTKL